MPPHQSAPSKAFDERGSRTLAEHDVEKAQEPPEGSDCINDKSSEASSSSPPLFKPMAAAFSPDPEFPTNQRLLGTAFFSFLIFALVQITFAVIAGSKAMIGDSSAMIVDSFTYLFNWVAERRKNRFDELNADADDIDVDPVRAAYVRKRNRRKLVLQLEIIPPLISVATLIIVTIMIIKSAVGALLLKVVTADDEPNIFIMMGFSVFNLLLDVTNVFCFARAKHLKGYKTADEEATVEEDPDCVCKG